MPKVLSLKAQQQINQAVELLQQGDVIAYPTEAVYGLGCDPFKQQAVEKLFHVKQRPMEKGVILVAANIEQIVDWVD
ncbi:MAG: Sua5/YciO/YrdC/YwlC family protein, partial [Thiomicrorhabdus sp.]|nr:Sua5/YciO/YrdC/YwlC family protein [Thiomicrorhabdus sp.]